jgi:hypothetical protein
MVKNIVIVFLMTFIVFSSSRAESPPVLLASLDAGYMLSENDSRVTRYSSLLSTLDDKYTETPTQIGDMTVTAQRLLKDEYGIRSNLLTILEDVNRVIQSTLNNPKPAFKEWVAAYVVLVGGGQDHKEAALDLQALAQVYGLL